MAELKTKKTGASVAAFLAAIKDAQVRKDCQTIAGMMQVATKSKGEMWGSSIVGFGRRRLVYPNGRELDWTVIGFSPRKQNITLYVLGGLEKEDELLGKLGVHDCGKGCLYIKRLSDVHVPTLKKLIRVSAKKKAKSMTPDGKDA
jgi:hypothetical protein